MMGIPEIKYNQLGIAGHTEMDELFYNDRPMILVVYYKYWITALYIYAISTVSWGMMACVTMDVLSYQRVYIQSVNLDWRVI